MCLNGFLQAACLDPGRGPSPRTCPADPAWARRPAQSPGSAQSGWPPAAPGLFPSASLLSAPAKSVNSVQLNKSLEVK